MFTAVTTHLALFKNLFISLHKLVNNISLECTDKGLRIHTMDKGQIALVDVFLPSSSFQIYNCPHNYALGINIESLLKIMKLAKSNDILHLKFQENSYQLLMIFADSGNRCFLFMFFYLMVCFDILI